MTADELIARLQLVLHPQEGGYFRETYRSAESIAIDAGVTGVRSCSTAIYYLITPVAHSALHRLPFDEVFHFYLGDPVEMLELAPDGAGRIVTLGTDLDAGMTPQHVVAGGVWQGSRLRVGGRFALLGTTVAPGFDPADYEHADVEHLLASHPKMRDAILAWSSPPQA
jgi:predicted cupin superfamily sugar epimerase